MPLSSVTKAWETRPETLSEPGEIRLEGGDDEGIAFGGPALFERVSEQRPQASGRALDRTRWRATGFGRHRHGCVPALTPAQIAAPARQAAIRAPAGAPRPPERPASWSDIGQHRAARVQIETVWVNVRSPHEGDRDRRFSKCRRNGSTAFRSAAARGKTVKR